VIAATIKPPTIVIKRVALSLANGFFIAVTNGLTFGYNFTLKSINLLPDGDFPFFSITQSSPEKRELASGFSGAADC